LLFHELEQNIATKHSFKLKLDLTLQIKIRSQEKNYNFFVLFSWQNKKFEIK
jgi:two-component sensor histidine kinase